MMHLRSPYMACMLTTTLTIGKLCVSYLGDPAIYLIDNAVDPTRDFWNLKD
jgi:hypothetical protein